MNTTPTTIGATYGYARVSTEEQNEDRQLIALRQAGVDDSKIFVDHKSGKDFCRPSWRKLTRHLRRGDLLIITSIDRLGRNYNDILGEWRTLQILSFVAETERNHIRQRQREGIAAAKARGVRFGRPAMRQELSLVQSVQETAPEVRDAGIASLREAQRAERTYPTRGVPLYSTPSDIPET